MALIPCWIKPVLVNIYTNVAELSQTTQNKRQVQDAQQQPELVLFYSLGVRGTIRLLNEL